jgi:hypothetical protein
MKWLPFFVGLFLISCKHAGKTKPVEQTNKVVQEIGYEMPFKTETDTGYFKGYPSRNLYSVEETDSTMLGIFLSKLADKKELVLLDSQTLSHSVFIDQHKKIRYDTLRNKHTLLISEYGFGDNEFQLVKLNSKIIQDYKHKETDEDWQDILDYNGESFRRFSFKGKKFYYIQASLMDGAGMSAGNVYRHILYDSKLNLLGEFLTCRFTPQLFGDVNGDDLLDYADFDNSDFCTTVPSSDRAFLRLYSLNDKGEFVL